MKPEASDEVLRIIKSRNSLMIRAMPSSGKQAISYDSDKDLIIARLRAPAEENMANLELLKLLKRLSGFDFEIISGKTSKNKILKRV